MKKTSIYAEKQELNRLDLKLNRKIVTVKNQAEEVHTSLLSLHEKIDKHIIDENQTFVSLNDKVDTVKNAIDNVQVNGRKGLNESIQDIHRAITEVQAKASKAIDALQAESRTKFLQKPVKDILFGQSRLMKIFWLGIIVLLVNSILYPFGIHLDVISIVKGLVTRGS